MIVIVSIIFVAIITLGIIYKINTGAVDSSDHTKIEVVIPPKSSVKQIGEILKEKDLIKSSTFFNIYAKLFKVGPLKAGTYPLSRDMDLATIIETLEKGNSYNENEISIKFDEGVSMRKIAEIISDNTNNSYDDVIALSNDSKYIDELINKYWFITDEIKNDKLYYKLEGYLYPDTYRFSSKDVTVKEIFNKMLDEMDTVLTKYKDAIVKSNYSVHQILTIASIIEKESPNNEEYRKNISSTIYNRLGKNMSLGSDVTCYYALKIDNAKKWIEENCDGGRNCINYSYQSEYNTRLTDGSMNGKLPVGPISTISLGSIDASINPNKTDYIYFIANIYTRETFFYNNYNDFLKKKAELDSVNAGL